MRIVVVGGAGTIGKAVVDALSERHDVIVAGRQSGTVQVDIQSPDSVRDMYQEVGAFGALVCAAGEAHFGRFDAMSEQDLRLAIESKLLGQIRLVLLGRSQIADGGSFTLISGYVFDDPLPEAASFAVANGGVEGFVRGAALALPRGDQDQRRKPGDGCGERGAVRTLQPGPAPSSDAHDRRRLRTKRRRMEDGRDHPGLVTTPSDRPQPGTRRGSYQNELGVSALRASAPRSAATCSAASPEMR